jgi:hypothetical protein
LAAVGNGSLAAEVLEREVLATAPGARDSLGGEPGMVGEVLATAPAARDDAHLRGELARGGGVAADGGGGSTSRGRGFGVTEAGSTRPASRTKVTSCESATAHERAGLERTHLLFPVVVVSRTMDQ